MQRIYLDYNATTPIAPHVQEAMLPFLAECYGNPSSSHALGRVCHAAVEESRGHVARFLSAEPDEIVFTGCGTESNNLALKGVVLARLLQGKKCHLVISAIEHPAITAPAEFLRRLGVEVSMVPCDSQGVVRADEVAAAIREQTVLVSIMHANNEVGTIQPIPAIAQICKAKNILLHTDAAQSIGKLPFNVNDLGVDLLTIAGHKVYAPKGVGALYVRRGVALEPLLHGAGHEAGRRGGTENVPYIVGLGQALRVAGASLPEISLRLTRLRDRLITKLRQGIGPQLSVNGELAARLPNTASVNFPRCAGAELLQQASEICASTGSACHSGETRLSSTLQAMGVAPEIGRGVVRFSVGWYTTDEEIDRACEILLAAWEAVQDQKN